MAQVRITDNQGTVRDTIPLVQFKLQQQNLNSDALGRVTISRDDLNSISNLTPGEDRVFIEENSIDIWGGILRTPGRKGGKPTMLVDSFAEYMRRAQPVELGQEKVSVDDSQLIQECIDSTTQLSAGTVSTITTGETFIFSGVTQLEKARKVAEACGGELVFNEDRTVDYVDSRGGDKTGTTLSPANGSFAENTFQVDRDAKHGRTSHLKVYGVGQGTAQTVATIVPDDDPGSYENKAAYTNSSWSDGDDKIWDARTNKDLKNASALQTWGTTIAEELQDAEVRVNTVVKGTEVILGDAFHVEHPEESVNDDLRVVELTTTYDAAGPRYETVFSNYSEAHQEPLGDDHKDVGRYNQAFEGDLTQIQQGPGRGPVGPSNDYYIYVYYPDDVQHEVNAQVLVKGTNYRSFHSGSASGGEHTHPVPINITSASGAGDIDNVNPLDVAWTLSNGESYTDTFSLPLVTGDGAFAYVYFSVQLQTDSNSSGDVGGGDVRIRNTSTGTNLQPFEGTTTTYDRGDFRLYQASQSGDVEGDSIEVRFDCGTGTDLDYRFSYGGIVYSEHAHLVDDTETATSDGEHTHNPQSGIVDFNDYPSGVDVFVNGSSQGTSFGDGTGDFEEVVAVGGELSQGWNTIRLTSDTLGHLDATMSADLYRQSL